jgi:rSAM/selenodomain-associated transferase 2
VIVPALNEAGGIGRTLARIPQRDDVETIVVDGGSSDATPEIAKSGGARLVSVPPPRARQMNLGAAEARGDIYVFLHADTLLPEEFEDRVRRTSADPSVAAGAFPLRIESARPGIRWVERGADLRSRYLSLPYGDQALFVRSSLFWELGGFPLLPIMEDCVFVRRLARKGRIALVDRPVLTSGRRWDRLGITRTTLLNQLMVLGYSLGIAPERLAAWYRRGGKTRATDR